MTTLLVFGSFLATGLLLTLVSARSNSNFEPSLEELDTFALDIGGEPDNGVAAVDYVGSVDGKSFYASDVRMNVPSCLDFCHSNGMHMATITSAAQNNFISDFLLNGGYSRITFFYLAGWDLFGEGDFKWMRTGQSWTYSRWVTGHPQVGQEGRGWNCVAVNRNGGWQNQNCSDSEPHRYVIGPLCEVP